MYSLTSMMPSGDVDVVFRAIERVVGLNTAIRRVRTKNYINGVDDPRNWMLDERLQRPHQDLIKETENLLNLLVGFVTRVPITDEDEYLMSDVKAGRINPDFENRYGEIDRLTPSVFAATVINYLTVDQHLLISLNNLPSFHRLDPLRRLQGAKERPLPSLVKLYPVWAFENGKMPKWATL